MKVTRRGNCGRPLWRCRCSRVRKTCHRPCQLPTARAENKQRHHSQPGAGLDPSRHCPASQSLPDVPRPQVSVRSVGVRFRRRVTPDRPRPWVCENPESTITEGIHVLATLRIPGPPCHRSRERWGWRNRSFYVLFTFLGFDTAKTHVRHLGRRRSCTSCTPAAHYRRISPRRIDRSTID